MAEPLSTTIVTAFAAGAAGELGRRAADYACDEISKAAEAGWQRHDEANEALGTGLSQRKTAQA